MALRSSGLALGGELGLRLLLSPASSSILVRSACGIVGLGLPVYCTCKAIERQGTTAGGDEAERSHWLTYWAVCGCLSVAESIGERWVSWLPFYYHAKLAFLIWLQVPPHSSGAKLLYRRILRPLVRRHQRRMDTLINGTRTHLGHFVTSHQSELAYAAQIVHRVALAALRFGQDSFQALKDPDDTPEQSPRPRLPAAPSLLHATLPTDASTTAPRPQPSVRTGQQRDTRRSPPPPLPSADDSAQRSPMHSPPYRGANASPQYPHATTPPGPNTFPSGSPSVHQQSGYETDYVRSLRGMYRTDGPEQETERWRGL